MPYLDEAAKERQDEGALMHRPGELNYRLTEVVNEYVITNGLSYQSINDVMGALSSAAAEFYRRAAAPYEDKKRAENGDVYPVSIGGTA